MKLRQGFPAGLKNILFDLGNVLVDLDVWRTVDAFSALRIGGLRPADIHPHQRGFFLDYELGELSDEGFLAAIRERYDCRGIADEQIWAAWNALLLPVDPERFELVNRLRGSYRLFVLSNTNGQHIRHLNALYRAATGESSFEPCFERCFYSHRMHLRKPDPEIYRRVMSEAALDPAQTLFVDDNACNLTEAEALGLKTYHLTGGERIFNLFG